ncbi:MAG: hypothetical protein WC943_17600, partial [Elusimicrobiota bacterium]
SSASDKTIVMAPGMVPLISPEMVSSPAPEPVVETAPASEDASELKIALEPRATLGPSSPTPAAPQQPRALAGDAPPLPTAGEQSSSDAEFKIVLERRASVAPSVEKVPPPRALAGEVPPPPSAGEQPSSDSEFKIVLEPRATIKAEPSSDKTVVLPPGWKPGGGTPA